MSDTYTEFTPAQPIDRQALDRQGYAPVNYGLSDDRKIVIFYNRPVHNPRKSQEEGRPVHENKIYVKIGEPGEMNLNTVDRPVTQADTQRWPRQWAQFQNNQKQIPDGTPVDLLFPSNPALSMTMKGFGIHTIEQLAHLSAEGISRVGMGAQDWVNKAKVYLDKSEKGVAFHKFETALAERDNEIAVLRNSVNMLKAQLEQVLKSQSRTTPSASVPHSGQLPDLPDFDVQTAQINAREPMDYELPPTAFTNDITTQPKRRGRPPGSKNKET